MNLFSSFPGGIDSSHLEMTSLKEIVHRIEMLSKIQENERKGNAVDS